MPDKDKKDPTIKSTDENRGAHEARPIDQADDYVGDKSFSDNPDKPHKSSIAQVEDEPDRFPGA